ncbi:MAG: GMC family oxidoreductase N-terminal domain-containing protein, partial [Myxococcales bacterium]|nr:GMC family oxidoreductase N-terminal domain-containing protein [Myxococcales bacterium]
MNVGNGAIIRASDVSRGQQSLELAADVVIVGSGASGATAARVLSEAGLDVVLVEEGPYIRPDELRSDVFTNARRVWRDLGFQLAEGRSMIGLLQGVCVGGSTAINGAIVHRLPEAIWDNWRATTPIEALTDLGALHRVYDQLDHELSVAPAPDEVLGRNNELMREACANLGWQGNPIRRNVSGCRGSAHCLQGCPTERRQSMDVSYVPRALRQGARLVVGCRVGRVRFEGARAVAVEGELGHDDGGSIDVTVRARTAVCLAASAVQTPNILRKSGLGRRYPWL